MEKLKACLKKQVILKTVKNSGQQQLNCDYRIYRLSTKEWIKYSVIGLMFNVIVSYTFYHSYKFFFLMVPVSFLYPLLKRKSLKEKRTMELKLQFKEGVRILASSLNAGYSVENAFLNSERELKLLYKGDDMIVREFMAINKKIKMHQTVENAIEDFARRSGIGEIENFSRIFSAAKRNGGQLSAIMNHTADVIREKIMVQEEIITLTASRRFEQKIMNMLPFLIILYVGGTSPGFFDVLYETIYGKIIMTVCLCLYGIAIALSDKILKIEV